MDCHVSRYFTTYLVGDRRLPPTKYPLQIEGVKDRYKNRKIEQIRGKLRLSVSTQSEPLYYRSIK